MAPNYFIHDCTFLAQDERLQRMLQALQPSLPDTCIQGRQHMLDSKANAYCDTKTTHNKKELLPNANFCDISVWNKICTSNDVSWDSPMASKDLTVPFSRAFWMYIAHRTIEISNHHFLWTSARQNMWSMRSSFMQQRTIAIDALRIGNTILVRIAFKFYSPEDFISEMNIAWFILKRWRLVPFLRPLLPGFAAGSDCT